MIERIEDIQKAEESESRVDETKAVELACKFLEQYHSPVVFKSIYKTNQSWIVSIDTGLLFEEIIHVSIDANTGKILRYD